MHFLRQSLTWAHQFPCPVKWGKVTSFNIKSCLVKWIPVIKVIKDDSCWMCLSVSKMCYHIYIIGYSTAKFRCCLSVQCSVKCISSCRCPIERLSCDTSVPLSCTYPQRQPPTSARICILQSSRMTALQACSKPLPAGSCRSPAPLLLSWSVPSTHSHTHPTCKEIVLQTWRDIKHYSTGHKYRYCKSSTVIVLLWCLCCTSHHCVHTAGSALQSQACWCDPLWAWCLPRCSCHWVPLLHLSQSEFPRPTGRTLALGKSPEETNMLCFRDNHQHPFIALMYCVCQIITHGSCEMEP